MHIHISPPLGTPWKISEVKKISMSALYFENAFEAILPKGRRGNQFARSNKLDNYLFKDLNLDQCFEWIRNSTHMKSLVWLLNPWDDGEASPARNTFPSLNTAINDRFYGWNFGNLGYSEPVLGTIGM